MVAYGPRVRCDEDRLLSLVREGKTNVEVAASFGVATRTVDRWRATRPALNVAINAARADLLRASLIPCPSLAAYVRGCRCAGCRAVNAARCRPYNRAWEARRRATERAVA